MLCGKGNQVRVYCRFGAYNLGAEYKASKANAVQQSAHIQCLAWLSVQSRSSKNPPTHTWHYRQPGKVSHLLAAWHCMHTQKEYHKHPHTGGDPIQSITLALVGHQQEGTYIHIKFKDPVHSITHKLYHAFFCPNTASGEHAC